MEINSRTMLAAMVFRSLRNNLRISLWALLTLTTCAALVTLFTTIRFEIEAKMKQTLRSLGANAVAYPTTQGETDWPSFERAAQHESVRFARLAVRVALIKESPVAMVAADPIALAELTPYWAVTGKRPTKEGECLVGRHVAESLNLKIGQNAHAEWPVGGQASAFSVVGIIESGDEDDDRVFVTSSPAPGDVSYALLSVAGGETAMTRLQATLAATASRIEIKPLRQIMHGEEQVLNKIAVLCSAALGAVLVLTALGVSASMLARVVERKKEFALMRALGACPRSVVKFLLAECATVGGIGAVAGFAGGTLLAALVVRQIFKVSISPHVMAFVAAFSVTTAVALLAGVIACRRMLRLQPAMALRGE